MTKTADNSVISPSSPKNNTSTKGAKRSKDDFKLKCKKSTIIRTKVQRSSSLKSQSKSPHLIKAQQSRCLQHLKRALPESSEKQDASQLDILLEAISYINGLMSLLDQDDQMIGVDMFDGLKV